MPSGNAEQVRIKGQPHRWAKGESGNPSGRKNKHDCLLDCIKEELEKKEPNGLTKEQMVASALVQMASRGNIKAIGILLEYTTPKPVQALDVNSTGKLEIVWRYEAEGKGNDASNGF